MQKLSAYILTYNEAAKIEAAVASVLWGRRGGGGGLL
jgi:glycosyltransferase involved in cell wall biosynthesis